MYTPLRKLYAWVGFIALVVFFIFGFSEFARAIIGANAYLNTTLTSH